MCILFCAVLYVPCRTFYSFNNFLWLKHIRYSKPASWRWLSNLVTYQFELPSTKKTCIIHIKKLNVYVSVWMSMCMSEYICMYVCMHVTGHLCILRMVLPEEILHWINNYYILCCREPQAGEQGSVGVWQPGHQSQHDCGHRLPHESQQLDPRGWFEANNKQWTHMEKQWDLTNAS